MKQQWTEEELEEFWRLSPEELKLLQNKTGKTRLSFIFMLKYFKIFGYFSNEREIMSPLVIAYLSRQVDVEVVIFNTCHFTSRTGIIHRQQIRKFLGFRPPQKSDAKLFINWLIEKVLPEGRESPSFIKGKSYEYFRKIKIEPFSSKKMERYIFSALNTFEISLFENILRSLTKENKQSLLDLLTTQENQTLGSFYLVDLKQDAGNVSLESILEEIKRIKRIQEIGLPDFPFNGITPRLLEKYKTRIVSERPSEIREHKEPMKYATLAIFCYVRGQQILDNLVDLLIQVIHKIGKRSENKVNKKLITELKKVGGKQAILVDLAKVIVDNPDGVIKEVVYPVVKAEILQEIIKESQLTKGYKEQVYTFMRASYGSHYRRMLAPILETISFQSNNSIHQPVLKALKILKKYLDSTAIYYPIKQKVPIKGVIKPGWQEIIIEKIEKKGKKDKPQERVNRINYEIAVLKALREGLRCKEIWVNGANKYRNPDEDLPADFVENRDEHYSILNKTKRRENLHQNFNKK